MINPLSVALFIFAIGMMAVADSRYDPQHRQMVRGLGWTEPVLGIVGAAWVAYLCMDRGIPTALSWTAVAVIVGATVYHARWKGEPYTPIKKHKLRKQRRFAFKPTTD